MSVKETANALGVDCRTINRHVAKLYPGKAINGIASRLDEMQVTEIKQVIERSGRNDLDNVVQVRELTTGLEIAEMTLKVIAYHKSEADRLRSELAASSNALALAAPKVEMAEALMRCDRNMSITDACKHFGLHPKTEVFPYLRHHGYLTTRDLPTQAAIDAGYLELKETVLRDGSTIAQAVVAVWQLENWRSHVVHQVKRWCGEMAV
jgi:phage antirepressor YoqD-like protein